jgi:hypothetical protein
LSDSVQIWPFPEQDFDDFNGDDDDENYSDEEEGDDAEWTGSAKVKKLAPKPGRPKREKKPRVKTERRVKKEPGGERKGVNGRREQGSNSPMCAN